MTFVIGNMKDAAAKIYISGIVHHTGPHYFERVVNTVKREMAKEGIFAWSPGVDNMLFEIVPAPEPWVGQWCYKLRCVHVYDSGQVQVCEFYLPQSQVELARADKLSELQ